MTIQTNISFEEEVWYSDDFQELKRKKKLSYTINTLLKSRFSLKASELPADEGIIEDRLRDLAAEKALLMERKDSLKKKAEKEEKVLSPDEIYRRRNSS